jgi:hypothetical protein
VQTLFSQSDAALWCSVRFDIGWLNVCKIEDAADRIFKSLYPNIELYVHEQMTKNASNIKKAQKTAMTSPFCIHSSGSRDLQFVIGHGSVEVTRFENAVTDGGHNCIFRSFLDDLCARFMTEKFLGALATEEVTLHYLDEDGQMCSWSAPLLELFEYAKCVLSPSQLREVHVGRGPNEKCNSSVCSLFPVDQGWRNMSLAKSQLLQSVYKRLHTTFTIGSSRSVSLNSKDGTYDSPLPLTNEVLGGGPGIVERAMEISRK